VLLEQQVRLVQALELELVLVLPVRQPPGH
jgi:hypothetical protein